MGGRCVYEDTSGLHSRSEFVQYILLGLLVEVDRGSMSVTAVRNKMFSLVECVMDILCAVHREYRREFLVSELLAYINALNFADEDLCAFRNVNSGECRYGVSLLTDDLCVERTVDDNCVTNLVRFGGREEVAASFRELGLYLVIYLVEYDDRLLGRADHTVIEGLGMDYRVYCEDAIRGLVDDSGGIAGTYAESGLAAGVCCLYHSGTACSEDYIRFLHYKRCHIEAGSVYPGDDIFGSARLYCRISYYSCGFDR